jgi:hypothetical protein
MAIVFDKCIQRSLSPALNPPIGSQLQAARSGATPHQMTLRSDYVPSPPSPVDGVKPPVTQDIISTPANPEAERSLRLDFKRFIQAAGPGAYQVAHFCVPSTLTLTYSVGVCRSITQGFLCPQTRIGPNQTIQVGSIVSTGISFTHSVTHSYAYLANERTLIIMTNTHAHENIIVCFVEKFMDAIRRQQIRNPLLKDPSWMIHANRSAWYEEGGSDQYTADMAVFYDGSLLLALEVAFTQDWDVLCRKIDRMLTDEATWGVMVVKITETSRWSPPSRAATRRDFISSDAWKERALSAQAIEEYGGLSVNGLEWTKRVTCNAFFFPSDWRIEDGDPPSVSCPALPSGDVFLRARSIHWKGTSRILLA